jgi:hypothetical protein
VRLAHLEARFDKLAAAGYEKTSEQTNYPPHPGAYNCIAWAASDVRHFWWPDPTDPTPDWPRWSKREETIEAFVSAFKWLGYVQCDNSRLELGFEKVALYAIGSAPKHMARQLKDGTWTSKCGGAEDITHYTLDALESYGPSRGPNQKAEYGSPVLFMKRAKIFRPLVRLFLWAEWRTSLAAPRLGEYVWKNF